MKRKILPVNIVELLSKITGILITPMHPHKLVPVCVSYYLFGIDQYALDDFHSPFLYVNGSCWIAYHILHINEDVSTPLLSCLAHLNWIQLLFFQIVSTC
jgi:hypothetical protein